MAPKEHSKEARMVTGDPRSPTRLFHELNRQFFGGRLPRFSVSLRRPDGLVHGECLPERRLIRLSRSLSPSLRRQYLLHEMCHIGAHGHGVRFQAKLRRLARQGETWALAEVEELKIQVLWQRLSPGKGGFFLQSDFEELAKRLPHFSFVQVCRYLVNLSKEYPGRALNAITLHRRAPWLLAEWEKACREADQLSELSAKR